MLDLWRPQFVGFSKDTRWLIIKLSSGDQARVQISQIARVVEPEPSSASTTPASTSSTSDAPINRRTTGASEADTTDVAQSDQVRERHEQEGTTDVAQPDQMRERREQQVAKLEAELKVANERATKAEAAVGRRKIRCSESKRIACDQSYECNKCEEKLPFTWEIDHIVALADGGDNTRDNLQALCNNCHAAKTRLEEEKRSK